MAENELLVENEFRKFGRKLRWITWELERDRDMGREIFGSDRGEREREREQRDALETRAKLVDTSF